MSAILNRLKSKTYWAAVLGAILTALDINGMLVSQQVSEAIRPYFLAAWPVIMIALREVTTTALSEK
jgi:uncharacterized membrane protein